ncbi:MAG: NADH-quinone oxidoreductase subunit NuoF [Acidimicrobiia bacterium]
MAFRDAPDIVFARMRFDDSHTLARYRAEGGYEGLARALSMEPGQVVEEVRTSGLTGRGGAGFPTAQKWSLLPAGVFPRYVVVNGDESEPGTFKDRQLMERDPHQLIEGALICAWAVQASRVFLYVRGEMALAQERLARALNEAYEAGFCGPDVCGSGWSMDVVLHWGAGAYIVGEETALLESLEGKRAFPRIKPPFFPAVKGLYHQPTVVNNVETLSNLPWILRNGGAAFAALGGGRSTGTRIFSLSGHVQRPGNYEVEMVKTTFRDLIEHPELGGGVREGHALKCFIPGGASAPWLFPEHLDTPLDADEVAKLGTMLGSGAVVVMDETTCAVRAAWRVVRFFAHESCGQCTPCREGTTWLERILYRIESGAGREEDLDLLLDVSDNISVGLAWPPRQTTICPLGPSAVSPIASSIQRFRDEYLVHIKEGGCPRG